MYLIPVIQEIGDEFPERVMWEDDTVRELEAIGFRNVEVLRRLNLATVLTATKPREK